MFDRIIHKILDTIIKQGLEKEKQAKQRVEQDYARNVIHDRETGHDKAAAY